MNQNTQKNNEKAHQNKLKTKKQKRKAAGLNLKHCLLEHYIIRLIPNIFRKGRKTKKSTTASVFPKFRTNTYHSIHHALFIWPVFFRMQLVSSGINLF